VALAGFETALLLTIGGVAGAAAIAASDAGLRAVPSHHAQKPADA
jgi:hypothetical protein